MRKLFNNTVVVEETFKYAATPEDDTAAKAAWAAIQTCREVYNHALTQEYQPAPESDKPSYTTMQNKLPTWKDRWPEWKRVYSKCLQMAIRRIKQSETVLDALKDRGYNVGQLKWKAPREYRSIVYNQSGFDVDSNAGRGGRLGSRGGRARRPRIAGVGVVSALGVPAA